MSYSKKLWSRASIASPDRLSVDLETTDGQLVDAGIIVARPALEDLLLAVPVAVQQEVVLKPARIEAEPPTDPVSHLCTRAMSSVGLT